MTLEAQQLTKRYGTKTALSDVSFTLHEGVYALLGPNGAGKTTLMNILAGVLSPTAGRALWNGEAIDSPGADYRARLGFLPQTPGMYNTFTAAQYLRYMAALKGVFSGRGERAALDQHIDELLRQVNLSDEARRRVGTFSGGMRQRLGVAQALLGDPDVLILDEPTAGLDPQERMRLRNLVSTLAPTHIVLWSTHIVSDVENMAQQILLLSGGKLLAMGTAAALLSQIEGQVWTLAVPMADAARFQAQFPVSNVTWQEDKTVLRLLAPRRPAPEATVAQPDLEDLYLFHFKEKNL